MTETPSTSQRHREAPAPVSELDWTPDQARDLGEQTVGLWEELLASLTSLPVARRETRLEVQRAVSCVVRDEPVPIDELMGYLRSVVLGHSMYPGHPAFMAYISGAGTVPGAAADLLAAALNQNVGAWVLSPAATEIELQLIRWLADQLGLPDGAGGIVTSGGAVANLTALTAARDVRAGWDVRRDGVRAGPPLVLYASEEAHAVIDRAADLLGLGADVVRHVSTDEQFRMEVPELRRLIEADRTNGQQPLAVVGTAGTTATGSVDPLDQIADVCAEHDVWFHVDGAYGALAVIAPELRPLLAGIERADSVALDPHKWLYVPLGVGCTIVRDAQLLSTSFEVHPTYLHQDREQVDRGVDLSSYGPQFSRGFAALKIWVSLLAHGQSAYARRIYHDVELARYLHSGVVEHPEFEPMAPVALSIACFRFVPLGLADGLGRDQYLDLLNERLMTELQLDGRTFCSNAVLRGRYCLRACIVNFRTEAADVDRLLDVAAEVGARLDDALRPKALR